MNYLALILALVLATPGGSSVRFVKPRAARLLCDGRFDWIEALR